MNCSSKRSGVFRVVRSDPATQRSFAHGFTLLEMLVVMVLLSVIMLAMVSALRGAGQSSERIDARMEQQDEVRLAENFVRSTLGRASARPLQGGAIQSAPPGAALRGGSKPPVLFEGAPDHVAWVGVLPARYGAGGRAFLRLGLEPVGDGLALVMRYMAWSDQPNFPDWGAATSQVLLSDVSGLLIQYENDRPENMDVASELESPWNHVDYLPARAIVDLQRSSHQPLQWVVPIRVLPSSSPGGMLSGEDVIGEIR